MAIGRIAGICYFMIDGRQYSTTGDIKVTLNGIQREPIVDNSGKYVGDKETAHVGQFDFELLVIPDISPQAFQKMKNVTITAEMPSGTVYVGRNANSSGKVELSSEGGKFSGSFFCNDIQEMRK